MRLLIVFFLFFFFFNDTPPPEIYPLPLHDALPICCRPFASSAARRTFTNSSKLGSAIFLAPRTRFFTRRVLTPTAGFSRRCWGRKPPSSRTTRRWPIGRAHV